MAAFSMNTGLAPALSQPKGLRGSTFGPASAGRVLSPEEKRAVVEQMKRDGKI